jgi:lipopolysaccharide heptosyltransferase II
MTFLLWLISKFIHSYKLPIQTKDFKKILVVDPNYIGDMLLSSPVYRALKNNFGNIRLESLVYGFTKPALETNPHIDKIYELPQGSLLKQLKILLFLRKQKYDLVLQLNTSLRTNFLMWLIQGKYRLGYDYFNRGCFNNLRVPIATRTAQTKYRVDECLELLEKAFDWKIEEREMIFPIRLESHQRIIKWLSDNGISKSDTVIGIHSNCRSYWNERRWQPEKFAKLAEELIERYQAKIVFTGSKDDQEYIKTIASNIRYSEKLFNLAGEISLNELGAILHRFNVFITVNTAPMQIAVSQNTPTVALMGVTPPAITYPVDNPRFQFVLGKSDKLNDQNIVDPKDTSRMESITVKDILEKVMFLFNQ